LIFPDEYGLPTFQPTVAQLLGEEFAPLVKISWDKSQIRTFQYAPWNSKRQVYDTDRCGIEKGSVFVLDWIRDSPDQLPPIPEYVGYYKNEGFGKIIVNPEFLSLGCQGNGRWIYTILPNTFGKSSAGSVGNDAKGNSTDKTLTLADSCVLHYLQKQQTHFKRQLTIYKEVNTFIESKKHLFVSSASTFAAQWGHIRSLASQYPDKDQLKTALFGEATGYLNKGIEKEKWDKEERRSLLNNFFEKLDPHEASEAMVYLATAMSKICSMPSNK